MKKPKLCYVLPEAASSTHMKYNVEFVEALSTRVDLYLILERGVCPPNAFSRVTVCREVKSGGLIRVLRTLRFLIDARVRGYRRVYVHYSFAGALLASLVPGLTVYYWNCGMPWQYPQPWFREWYESLTYKRVDHVVTGAAVLLPRYAAHYGFDVRKGIVIPNWIDVEDFERQLASVPRGRFRAAHHISETQRVLFFMQRLAERKGAHYLPRLLRALPEDVTMVVAGEGPYREQLVHEFEALHLSDRVRMLGRIPNAEIPEVLSATDVYILPSEEEGMPHALLEAMGASVPTVAFNVGGVSDMYPKDFKEYVIEAKNVDAFSKKLATLLDDKSKRVALGHALRAQVRNYDKGVVLESYMRNIVAV